MRRNFYYVASDLYLEAPVRPWLSAVATGRIENVPALPQPLQTGGEATLGMKVSRRLSARTVGALQAVAAWRDDADPACAGVASEFRGLYGVGLGKTFFNFEAGARVKSGGCTRGRYEATVGYKPGTRWLLLGQAFMDDDLTGGADVKAQASFVRYSKKGVGLQLGGRFGLGEGGEKALLIGVWTGGRRKAAPAEPEPPPS